MKWFCFFQIIFDLPLILKGKKKRGFESHIYQGWFWDLFYSWNWKASKLIECNHNLKLSTIWVWKMRLLPLSRMISFRVLLCWIADQALPILKSRWSFYQKILDLCMFQCTYWIYACSSVPVYLELLDGCWHERVYLNFCVFPIYSAKPKGQWIKVMDVSL